MTIRSQSDIVNKINTDLADNNAGLISAADVRENMKDIAESINVIVGSGNFDSSTPFTGSNVRAKIVSNQYGFFVAESGIKFPNNGNTTQYVAYPGAGGISHTGIADLTVGNPHTQYVNVAGYNKLTGNFAASDKWLNASGNVDLLNTTMNNHGLKFEYVSTDREVVHIGSGLGVKGTSLKFDIDNSSFNSAKGIAQAWVKFEGTSGNIVVNSSYNVSAIHHSGAGYYVVYFTPGTFTNSNYVAVGHSNSTTGSGSPQDFDINTVGLITRNQNYLTFVVRNDNGEYVNARVNDLVIFGNASGVTASSSPTIVNL
jgi:hypothetical protein